MFSGFEDRINGNSYGQTMMMPLEFGSDNIVTLYNELENLESLDPAHPALLFPEDNFSQMNRPAVERRTTIPTIQESWEPDEEMLNDCIRNLSKLGIDLLEHSQLIPPQSIHDQNTHLDTATVKRLAKRYDRYQAEDTLRLTERLINIYSIFLTSCIGPQSSTLR